MNKPVLKPLPFALACLLAAPVWAASPAPEPADAGTDASVSIPLDIIREVDGDQTAYRLGINVGVNDAEPKEYMFDTGSTAFDIAVGPDSAGQPWFPLVPGAPATPTDPAITPFGDGTQGNLGLDSTVGSIAFYNSATNARVVGYDTAAGLPVVINTGNVATRESLDQHAAGPQVGYFLPAEGRPFTFAEIAAQHPDTTGQVPVYLDATWQQQVAQGTGPEDDGNYGLFGIFGAGAFDGNGVLGNLTNTGYVVAANNQLGSPNGCTDCGHVILGLTPEVRAQFLSIVPWSGGASGTFPLSGAPVSAQQSNAAFVYTLDGGQHTAALATLLDSGSFTIFLDDQGLLDAATAAGEVGEHGALNPGITLTATGNSDGAKPVSVQTGNAGAGDISNVVIMDAENSVTRPGEALYGISFFFHNSVMYDLENQATGYTPFYVSIDPVSTASGGYSVTSSMAPQGIAGVISGDGSFTVGPNALAQLSNVNTYTGPTSVGPGGLLALAGPGSIAQSSNVQVDGLLDVSRAAQTTVLQSLSGSGTGVVGLGNTTLELVQASGTFSGAITDGGIADNAGGRLMISGGTETLAGRNTFTGPTGIGAQGGLILTGSLASGVANMGTLMLDDGQIGGTVLSTGRLLGDGHIEGDLAASGIVAPGTGPGTYQTLAVGGNYVQQAGAEYLVQLDPASNAASLLSIGGTATLQDGATIGLSAAQPGIYQIGTRVHRPRCRGRTHGHLGARRHIGDFRGTRGLAKLRRRPWIPQRRPGAAAHRHRGHVEPDVNARRRAKPSDRQRSPVCGREPAHGCGHPGGSG